MSKRHPVRVCTLGLLLAVMATLDAPTAAAQLAANQVVFTSILGKCGVVEYDGLDVKAIQHFYCATEAQGAEGVHVTTDGTKAVITHPFSHELSLWDLNPLPTGPPTLLAGPIPSDVDTPEEIDLAPDDSFGIVVGTFDGAISRFTLSPFMVTETRPKEPVNCERDYTRPPIPCIRREDVQVSGDGRPSAKAWTSNVTVAAPWWNWEGPGTTERRGDWAGG